MFGVDMYLQRNLRKCTETMIIIVCSFRITTDKIYKHEELIISLTDMKSSLRFWYLAIQN